MGCRCSLRSDRERGRNFDRDRTSSGRFLLGDDDRSQERCLTATFSNGRQTLSLTNECSGLGVVKAEVKVVNLDPDGPIIYLRGLHDSTPFVSHLNGDATYTNARCCPTSGICAITDCDTADGVINDSSHASHCRLINDTTGQIITGGQITAGTEITDGELVYPSPTE